MGLSVNELLRILQKQVDVSSRLFPWSSHHYSKLWQYGMEFQVQIISHFRSPAFKNSYFALNFSQLIQCVVEVIQIVIVSVLQNGESAGVLKVL